jgi:hypothetical protein
VGGGTGGGAAVRLDSGVVDGVGREEVRMLDDRVEEDVMGLCTPMA